MQKRGDGDADHDEVSEDSCTVVLLSIRCAFNSFSQVS